MKALGFKTQEELLFHLETQKQKKTSVPSLANQAAGLSSFVCF